eukprot:GGOE01041499.1.p1 GENE.GGOE01041499.1~~GGOE01041499.1.p1  ORF type:complete len:295 (-),score=20.82 GGOE01041499.1:128-988(-)
MPPHKQQGSDDGFQLAVYGHAYSQARTVDIRHAAVPQTPNSAPLRQTCTRSSSLNRCQLAPLASPSVALTPHIPSTPSSLRRAPPRTILRTPRSHSVQGTPRTTPRLRPEGSPTRSQNAPEPKLPEMLLTEEEVNLIPDWQICNMADIPKGTMCCICQDEFALLDVAKNLPGCLHLFHRACVDRWLLTCRPTCPICVKQVCLVPATSPVDTPRAPAASAIPLPSDTHYHPCIVRQQAHIPTAPRMPSVPIFVRHSGRSAQTVQLPSRSAAVPTPNSGRRPRLAFHT